MKLYTNCKIYGPYKAKDNRLRIFIKYDNGKEQTISYPKYLMEPYLGRYLTKTETIHHIDGDPLNNDINNLQILSRSEHAKLEAKRLTPQEFICPLCNKIFQLSGKKLHWAINSRQKEKSGPFCSKSCAGKYGKLTQLNKIEKLPVIPIESIYNK